MIVLVCSSNPIIVLIFPLRYTAAWIGSSTMFVSSKQHPVFGQHVLVVTIVLVITDLQDGCICLLIRSLWFMSTCIYNVCDHLCSLLKRELFFATLHKVLQHPILPSSVFYFIQPPFLTLPTYSRLLNICGICSASSYISTLVEPTSSYISWTETRLEQYTLSFQSRFFTVVL